MSGLYNAIFGRRPEAEPLLIGLSLEAERAGKTMVVPRFRDAWVERHGDAFVVRVHTRAGGWNRERFATEIETMRDHPWFADDQDLKFDPTYADFYYRVPLDLIRDDPNLFEAFRSQAHDPVDVDWWWKQKIAELETMSTEALEELGERVSEHVKIGMFKPEGSTDELT